MTSPCRCSLTAIVLAGGSSRRLGGIDKTAIEINGQTLLDRVLGFWPDGTELIVVGPQRRTQRSADWYRESPVGGGPLSAIAAALPAVTTDLVALVGADMPLLGPAISALIDAATEAIAAGSNGAWLVTASGRQQPLACCLSKDALVAAMPTDVYGRALLPTLRSLVLADVPVSDDWLLDIDTEDDLERVQLLLHQQEGSNHG